jgi:hypothetical protein
MSILSIRFKRAATYEALKRRAAQRLESASGLGERLIDEGLRMDAHPGVVFRDGPAGRRAGLAAGPDVREVALLLRTLSGPHAERISTAAERTGLTTAQVRAVARYYAEYSAEIDAEIDSYLEAADRELVIWERERRLLSG